MTHNIPSKNIKEYKIFVGNVPYHCTQEEFETCFVGIKGFVKAEIINVYKTHVSRGFGFATMKTLFDAELLKQRNDIVLKGRTLRFTSYHDEIHDTTLEHSNLTTIDTNTKSNTTHINTKYTNFANYVFVDGIPLGTNREWLKEKFANYGPIGRYFVSMNPDTGESLTHGMIEITDQNRYRRIITMRWHEIDGKIIETTRYKSNHHDRKIK